MSLFGGAFLWNANPLRQCRKHFCEGDAKSTRQPGDIHQCGISGAPLDSADVGPVQTRAFSKLFQR